MTNHTEAGAKSPPEIWLEPSCHIDPSVGRLWCQHKLDDCDECGTPAVRYVIARPNTPDEVKAGESGITDDMIEAALHAIVPGGSQVWVWLPQKDAFTPHQTARDVMRCALAAVLRTTEAPAQEGE